MHESSGADPAGPGPAAAGTVALAAALDDGPPDAPVLVLGNSLGTSSTLWEPQLAAFRTRFRVLRYEHRGHGAPAAAGGIGVSPAPAVPGGYPLDDLGADVLRLLDSLGVRRACYCGLSLGGMIGMWLAAHAPDRIAALGLCCTSAFLPPAQLWTDRAAAARRGDLAAIADQVVGRWFTPAYAAREPGGPAAFKAALAAVDPEGYAGCCEAIAAMDLRPVLGSVTAPTLVLAGAEDPATPPWHGAVIAAGIRGSALRVIRGAAHLANVSAPGEVTAALLGHLAAAG